MPLPEPAQTRLHASSFLRHFNPERTGRPHIVCFPHAGAGAFAYSRWGSALAEVAQVIGVQLPGREDRVAEDCMTSSTQVVRAVCDELLALAAAPTVLFGHSMGASLAHAAALHLLACGVPLRALVVSGQVPAGTDRPRVPLDSPADATDWLCRLGGMPAHTLENAELMALWLPVLRADMQVVDSYFDEGARPTLDLALIAMHGSSDPLATAAQVAQWRHCTSHTFDCVEIEGGHFFPQTNEAAVLERLRALAQRAARPAGVSPSRIPSTV